MDFTEKVNYKYKNRNNNCRHKGNNKNNTKLKMRCYPKDCPFLDECLIKLEKKNGKKTVRQKIDELIEDFKVQSWNFFRSYYNDLSNLTDELVKQNEGTTK